MNISEKPALRRHIAKSGRVVPLSLISLLVAGLLGAGPAHSAEGIHCLQSIDYNKLSANELDSLYQDIDVYRHADKSTSGGKCVATIDYNRLSAEELEMQYRDIGVYPYARNSAARGKNVATINYEKLSPAELERFHRDINLAAGTGVASDAKSITARADK